MKSAILSTIATKSLTTIKWIAATTAVVFGLSKSWAGTCTFEMSGMKPMDSLSKRDKSKPQLLVEETKIIMAENVKSADQCRQFANHTLASSETSKKRILSLKYEN